MSKQENDVAKLMARLRAHPEVEVRNPSTATERLVMLVPKLLATNLTNRLSISTLMYSQYAFLEEILVYGSPDDWEWYKNASAKVRGWENPRDFLELTKRTIDDYLNWSFVPREHKLRTRDTVHEETVGRLFFQQPATIIAPILRGLRNVRH